MKEIIKNKTITWKFDSLSDYKRKMDELGAGDGEGGKFRADAWAGTKSWEQFITLLDEGDDKVTAQIKTETKAQIAELGKKYEEELKGYKFDVQGEFFDIGLVLSGVPEHWLEPEFEEAEKPKVDLIINGSFPDGTDLDGIVKNAGKVLAIARILEDHDVLVSIKAVTGAQKFMYGEKYKEALMETMVKGYDEPLNYSKCSAIITPTYLRRGWFRMAEVVAGDELKGNYGKIIDVDNSIELRDDSAVSRLERKLFKRGVK